jgi:hypothetical protein
MTARVGALLAVLWLTLPSQAAAQVWTMVSDRAAVGLSVGKASSVDTGEGGAWNATFELPMFPRWRVRADLGRVHWQFGEDMTNRAFPMRTKMTRVSGTVVKTAPQISALGAYAGGGAGLYWLPAPDEQGFKRFGLHVLAGIEVLLPNERAKIVGEVRIDGLGSSPPGRASVAPLQGSAVLGVRWTWKE